MADEKLPNKADTKQPLPGAYEIDADTEREAVLAALRLLPARLRSPELAELFGRTMHDPDLRRDFRSRPAEYLHHLGISYPKEVKLDVHVNSEDTLHIVLPHPIMGSRKARKTQEGKLVLSDEDMISTQTSAASHVQDNSYNTGNWFRDPTDRNDKRDKTSVTTGDFWDTFFEDKDPTAKDEGDTGKDGGTD